MPRGQPGAPSRGGEPDSRRSTRTTTTSPRSPTRSRRRPSWTRSTSRPSSPASGPTSRPAGTARRSQRDAERAHADKKWVTFTNGTHVDSLKPETAHPPLQLPRDLRERVGPRREGADPDRRDAGPLSGGDGDHGRDASAAAGPDHWRTPTTTRRRPPGRPRSRSGSSTTTAPGGHRADGHPHSGFTRDYDSFPAPGTTGRSWYFGDDGTLTDAPPAQAAADGFAYDGRERRRDQLHRRHRRGHRRALDRHAAATSGRRTPRARRSPTRPSRSRPTRRCSARAPSTSGSARRSRTSTSR